MTQPRGRACVHTLSIRSTRKTYGARVRKWSASGFRSRLAATGFTLNPATPFARGWVHIRDRRFAVWFVLSSQRLRGCGRSRPRTIGSWGASILADAASVRLPGQQIAQTRWRDFSGKTYRKILQRKRSARGRSLSALRFESRRAAPRNRSLPRVYGSARVDSQRLRESLRRRGLCRVHLRLSRLRRQLRREVAPDSARADRRYP